LDESSQVIERSSAVPPELAQFLPLVLLLKRRSIVGDPFGAVLSSLYFHARIPLPRLPPPPAIFLSCVGLAAADGIVPRQYSTGGKQKLFGISKRGNLYLRRMLIHGARAVLFCVHYDSGGFAQWVHRLRSVLRATACPADLPPLPAC
jgi:hypothetical protein